MLTSELMLAAIAIILAITVALLFAPVFVWVRQRVFHRGEEEPETSSDAAIEIRALAVAATNGVTGEGVVTPQNGVAADETATARVSGPDDARAHRDRTIRIISWAFLMAVAIFSAASGFWAATLPAI